MRFLLAGKIFNLTSFINFWFPQTLYIVWAFVFDKGNQKVSNRWICRSGQTGRTQDPLAYAYLGSNPSIHILI